MEKTNFSFHKMNYGTLPESITVVPLKDDVIFPHAILPLFLTGEGLVKAVNEAVSRNECIGVVALKHDVDLPKPDDFYEFGTAAKIVRVLESTPDTIKTLIEGVVRIKVTDHVQTEPYCKARIEEVREFTEKSETIDVLFQDQSLYKIIREYTREAGLRNLEREIASVCRKIAKEIVAGGQVTKVILPEIVEKFLGPRKYFYQVADEEDRVGVATGLAWTETGGDIIFVEVSRMKGEKELTLTGQLGDVMQESAIAALSYVRSNAKRLGIDENFYDTSEIHIHVPSGAIPKDGPSAGITMCMALISLLTDRLARREAALTGEITLTGNVLPVGGVKEKVLAAIRAGVKIIVLPLKNREDYEEIDKEIRDKIQCVYIQKVDDAIDTVLIQK